MLTIISGGQTGVDRGALDAALAENVPCGGWCPEGRLAEDGVIDAIYPLVELEKAGYRQRTRQNVMDTDATVIIYREYIVLKGGIELTLTTCIKKQKPYLLIDSSELSTDDTARRIVQFIAKHTISKLNFAGPRESGVQGIQAYTQEAVIKALQLLKREKAKQ